MSVPAADNSTELKSFLISLIGDAPIGILATDLSGLVSIANSRAASVFNLKADSLIDRPLSALAADFPELLEPIDESLSMGRVDFDIEEIKIRDRFFNVRARRLLEGYLMVFDDISKQVANRKQKTDLLNKLAAANRDLAEFAYISAHDMKSPIASLGGLLQAMNEEQAVKPEHQDLFEMMQRSVAALQDTVGSLNKILELKKSFDPKPQRAGLADTFTRVIDTMAPAIEASGAVVRNNFEASHSLPLQAAHLQSLLSNLLSNALKYDAAGRTPVVDFRLSLNEGVSRLAVLDNGRGINLDEYGSKVFGLFNRFDDSEDGTGVGLYIVRSIMTSCGGSVSVESAIGEGTSFLLEFPGE